MRIVKEIPRAGSRSEKGVNRLDARGYMGARGLCRRTVLGS